MQGVLAGFVTIGAVIGLGLLLAHLRVLDAASQRMLVRLAFFVASPALMITVLGAADVARIFSIGLVASIGSVVVAASIYLLLARLVWHRAAGDTVIGMFSSAYVNAANLGLPIAAYVLGNASLIAPMLLTQLLFLQPLGLAVLDGLNSRGQSETRRQRVLRIGARVFRNPLMLGSLAGVLLSLSGLRLPPLIADPLHLVGGMAVPAMLLAYGVSLRLGPLPGSGEPPVQVGTIVALKLIVQPVAAYLIATTLLGLHGLDVFAVTVIAALPTAQNVFLSAVRYNTGVVLARDTIFLSTLGSVPVLIVIAALLT